MKNMLTGMIAVYAILAIIHAKYIVFDAIRIHGVWSLFASESLMVLLVSIGIILLSLELKKQA